MKDMYNNEVKVGDEVAFAFYDDYNGECILRKAPIKSMCEDTRSVILDLRGLDILSLNEYEDGVDENDNPVFLKEFRAFSGDIILVKRKEEK